ncbi:hypothetical protein M758_UG262000 [Ceratodon purpureus]|nr:hypothetical protein M758_UG262000 [Ceratodon purpureus]
MARRFPSWIWRSSRRNLPSSIYPHQGRGLRARRIMETRRVRKTRMTQQCLKQTQQTRQRRIEGEEDREQ